MRNNLVFECISTHRKLGGEKKEEKRGRSISLQKAMNKYLFLKSVQGWDVGIS